MDKELLEQRVNFRVLVNPLLDKVQLALQSFHLVDFVMIFGLLVLHLSHLALRHAVSYLPI